MPATDEILNSLVELKDIAQKIQSDLVIAPSQIKAAVLSEISTGLGLVQSGEYRTGNSTEPGSGFTGIRIGYPGFSYSSDTWNLVGVNSDTLQLGIKASDGKLYAGAGAVVIDSAGITATLGTIGGFTIGATSIADTAGLVGMSSAVTAGDDIRYWAGHVTPASAPFYVTEAGALVATSATITGAITATSGTIAGWTVDADEIKKLAANVGITIDSATPIIKVGDTAGTHLQIDGANQRIRSSNYVNDTSGFTIESNGDAEFNNITIRGSIGNASVVEKLTISAGDVAIGSTPPTGPTAGTGLWLDETGLYGLNANTQQAVFSASTGKITAGAGKVALDASGLTLDAGTLYNSDGSVKWQADIGDGTTLGEIFTTGSRDSSTSYGGALLLRSFGDGAIRNTRVQLDAYHSDSTHAIIDAYADATHAVITLNGQQSDVDTIIFSDNNAYMFMVDAGLDAVQIGDNVTPGVIADFRATGIVFNEGSADMDFRVESNNNANMLVIDGGNDTIQIGGGTAISIIDENNYSPTLNNTTNVAASTTGTCYWYRIGSNVTVYGALTVDPTSAGTIVQLGVSLPVASNFSAGNAQCAGSGAVTTNIDPIRISGDVTNDRATFEWIPTDANNRILSFHFSYKVI